MGSLLIRVTIGLLFVVSAYICSKDADARKAATADTALVFPWQPEWFTLAGVLWMLVGGLSVLLGIFPRLGALVSDAVPHSGGDDPFPQGPSGRRPERTQSSPGRAPSRAVSAAT